MQGIQYSDFVEVFNCLTELESNLGDNDGIRTSVPEQESELGVRVEGVKSFYEIGVRVEKRILPESESESNKGFCRSGSRSQSRKIYARLPVLHKNLIKM